MQSPILSTGAAAWKAGHKAVRDRAFVFTFTPEELTYAALKQYAAQQARAYLQAALSDFDITPAQRVRLFATYVHAFINGAIDEAGQETPGG
ncbi:MAG TPA: hypothetical protein VF099_07345 [Ktedonobacterales bacterium]